MPYKRINPDEFFNHNDIVVYHTYIDDEYDTPSEYLYTTDIEYSWGDDNECAFDVRDLPRHKDILKLDGGFKRGIIRNAIEKEMLTLPKGVKYE